MSSQERGIRILALDGAGISAIGYIAILRRFMEKIGTSEKRPCEFFDLICGCGMSSIIAIMLGRLRMSLDDCSAQFETFVNALERENFSTFFPERRAHRYIAKSLQSIKIYRDIELSNTLLADSDPANTCKTFVLTISSFTPRTRPRLLRSYDHPMAKADSCHIWEAMYAASARPGVTLDPMLIPTLSPDHAYMDASFGHNNPSREALWEAMDVFHDRPIAAFVSLGLGGQDVKFMTRTSIPTAMTNGIAPPPTNNDSSRHVNNPGTSASAESPTRIRPRRLQVKRQESETPVNRSVVTAALQLLFDSDRVHREMDVDPRLLQGTYFRFHLLYDANIGYTDTEKLQYVKDQAYREIQGRDINVTACCKELISSFAPSCVENGLAILCLDGGGIRGLSSLVLLRNIMARVHALENNSEGPLPLPCKYFDLICGTSTGGLIAIMLGRLRMSVDECIAAYTELAQEVFGFPQRLPGPKFDAGKLVTAVTKVLAGEIPKPSPKAPLNDRKLNLPPDAPLKDPVPESDQCPVFVVTRDANSKRVIRLRTYKSGDNMPDPCTIVEACRATTAAPTYFEFAEFGNPKIQHCDGGMGNNNPSQQALFEAWDLWGRRRPIGVLLSLGTGGGAKSTYGGMWSNWPYIGLLEVVKDLKGLALDCNETHMNLFKMDSNMDVDKNCFRFSAESIGDIGLAEWKALDRIHGETLAYLEWPIVGKAKENCARALLQLKRDRDRSKL